jgi:hypothetical protein
MTDNTEPLPGIVPPVTETKKRTRRVKPKDVRQAEARLHHMRTMLLHEEVKAALPLQTEATDSDQRTSPAMMRAADACVVARGALNRACDHALLCFWFRTANSVPNTEWHLARMVEQLRIACDTLGYKLVKK